MKPFKLLAPFVNIKDIRLLKEAGADELYCGYVDSYSERRWPIYFQTINRRLKGASFEGFAVFKEAVKEAQRCGLPVYVTMNWHYTPEQYPWLVKTAGRISRLCGVKGLIVADMGLFLALKEMKYEKQIHISTGGTSFNSATVDFFSSLGASRAILDRQLTTEEIVDLIAGRKSDIEIEIFVFHTACMFVDGFCSFFHCGGGLKYTKEKKDISLVRSGNTSLGQGCAEIRRVLRERMFEVHSISGGRQRNFKFKPDKYPFGCNLCGLYKLKDISGITLKVVERGKNRKSSVKAISGLIKYLKLRQASERQYQQRARQVYFEITGERCSRFSCYCPAALINPVRGRS